jgi:hypothetical protein
LLRIFTLELHSLFATAPATTGRYVYIARTVELKGCDSSPSLGRGDGGPITDTTDPQWAKRATRRHRPAKNFITVTHRRMPRSKSPSADPCRLSAAGQVRRFGRRQLPLASGGKSRPVVCCRDSLH